jgi:DNA-binding CsgD family transcriptional regulator
MSAPLDTMPKGTSNKNFLSPFLKGKGEERSRHYRNLTPRECDVLLWLGRGKSNAEIGTILGIRAATVSKHLERIYPKLGVENRAAAISLNLQESTSGN